MSLEPAHMLKEVKPVHLKQAKVLSNKSGYAPQTNPQISLGLSYTAAGSHIPLQPALLKNASVNKMTKHQEVALSSPYDLRFQHSQRGPAFAQAA